MVYNSVMVEVRTTEVFNQWFTGLKDRSARARIQARIDRLQLGNPGDVKPVGEGVSEMRVHHGPGYRVYFVQQGEKLVVLLVGGDKKTQAGDVKRAMELARFL